MLPSSQAPAAMAFSRAGDGSKLFAEATPGKPLDRRAAPTTRTRRNRGGMTDTKTSGDKTLHVSPKTLSLKRPVEQNVVRQSFSHGRSKAVVVETVKRRPAPGAHKEAPP